jgi:hypothetical protein
VAANVNLKQVIEAILLYTEIDALEVIKLRDKGFLITRSKQVILDIAKAFKKAIA